MITRNKIIFGNCQNMKEMQNKSTHLIITSLQMILFTNLKEVKIDDKEYEPIPILKLTTGKEFNIETISNSEKEILNNLKKESIANGFMISINNKRCEP